MKKKLIEVALPLESINSASAREKSIRHGHPSTLHLWWARRPLAAARAVIFAQMVDDPSSHPDLFPTEEEQVRERERLFKIIEDLVLWENTTNEEVLGKARNEIWKSWRLTCQENREHPRAKELFDPNKLPAFHDPFAGGGALPLEAQRLGLESYASDLNPVAVLINKAMIEIPPKFSGMPPVNPGSRNEKRVMKKEWRGAQGLADDVQYYGKWMRDEAEKRIGHLYPKIEITAGMAEERPDLRKYVGKKLTVIAWIWVRTVKSPNPAFANVDVPLASTFMLSTKPGKEAYIDPGKENGGYRFTVRVGKPKDAEGTKSGTKLSRGANFKCLMSGTPMVPQYIKDEGKSGRMGARLMAIVAEGERGRVFLAPTPGMEAASLTAQPYWKPETTLPDDMRSHWTPPYGLTTYGDLFTPRQLVALTTFSDLVTEAREEIRKDAISAGLPDDNKPLREGGIGASGYAEAVGVYLSLGIGRCANYWSSLTPWGGSFIVQTFGRQGIPMVWDYAEGNPISNSTGNWTGAIEWIEKVISKALSSTNVIGKVFQSDAQKQSISSQKIISTDPPYYDNIGYADLSDYFYVWLRRSMQSVFPNIFATLSTPKEEELVATPYRHGSKEKAESFFLGGMTEAMHRIADQSHIDFPVTIYYAFKQSESDDVQGTTNTGWDTFLEAVIDAGFAISGTWPIRTERDQGLKTGNNVLASSIVLVCRKRGENAGLATRREFLKILKEELPGALKNLQRGNIAPVDLAQAAIGPGMAVFTRFSKVMESDGNFMSVKTALALINQVLDEVLTEQEGAFDPDSRWALAWFEQYGMEEAPFGDADVLSRAKNTSVSGLEEAGIVKARGGKVRLLSRTEMNKEWDPRTDRRLTMWETAQQMIRTLDEKGESKTSELVAKLGGVAETAKDLSYRLFSICERKGWAKEALAYNSLVVAWPEISRLAFASGQEGFQGSLPY